MSENVCPKCKKPVKKTVELNSVSSDGNFASYNYHWTCPCGYSNESVYGEG